MPKPWPLRVLIILAIAASFGRLGLHEFLGWDDPATIHQNPAFNPPTLPKIAQYWTAWGERAPMGLYVPLTYTVWGLLAKIAYLQIPDPTGIRLNPYVYHSANVILHVLAALAAFELLRRLVRSPWAACAGALLWGLHPVQVEPVAWASGTKDVLCGLLSLVALDQYVKFAQAADDLHSPANPPRRRVYYTLGLLAFIGAMLSKPTGIVVPIMALAIDHWCLHRSVRRSLLALAPWMLLMIPCMLWTKAAQSTIGMDTGPLWTRPLIALDALAFYLYKLLLPIHLGVDYGRRTWRVLEEGWLWYTWVLPVAVALLLVLGRRKAPALLAAGTLFLAGVLPVLGLVQFQFQFYSTVADHYLYLSMIGPALAMAWLASRWPTRRLALVCTFVLVALGMRSFDQGKHWLDDVTLFRHAIRVNPRSFVSHNNLGSALWQRREIGQAIAHFRQAIEIFPDYPTGHDNLAIALLHIGRRDEAIFHIGQVLRVHHNMPQALRPNLDRTHTLFGMYLLSRDRYDEAIENFQAALKINPQNEEAAENLRLAIERKEQAAIQPTTAPATAPAPAPAVPNVQKREED